MKTLVLIVLFLCGCVKDPLSTKGTGNLNFTVEFLFENEGCRIYRFYDGGRNIYYTNCLGQTKWSESCGKNCSRQVGVN